MTNSANNPLALSPLKQALLSMDKLEKRYADLNLRLKEPIAIIGMGCRFPGNANSPEEFWQILCESVDAVSEIPKDRWNVDDYFDPTPGTPDKMYSRWGAFLSNVDKFDPQFFHISPKETESMDPQQRLLLEVCWETIENSGNAPEYLEKVKTGVYIGIMNGDYAQCLVKSQIPDKIDAYYGTGNVFSATAGRLSHTFNLRGPNLAVDTACSSSLVAVHLACQNLRARECEVAIAGGVNLILAPESTIGRSQARMLSPSGRCKTFDASADGFVQGEGCGLLLLKPLSAAVAEGDRIHAVIAGSAVNQDGRSSNFTVPYGPAQEAVITQALKNAGVKPNEVSYIEAHGTGTSLGDPIEIQSLSAVFGKNRPTNQPLIVGSAKTNFGHLESAAGIAGLMKVVLALTHEEIPPILHFKKPNPHIPWSKIPLRVAAQQQAWKKSLQRRVAGVSSFGFSGTNAHVILEEAPIPPGDHHLSQVSKNQGLTIETKKSLQFKRPLHILALSARTKWSLLKLGDSYRSYIHSHPSASLADICFTASKGRSHFDHRLAICAKSKEELVSNLDAFLEGHETKNLVVKESNLNRKPKIAFLFSGHGSQYLQMARRLYKIQPTFHSAINQCDEILKRYQDPSLLPSIYPERTEQNNHFLSTPCSHTALFSIEYGLATLWRSWGIIPDAVFGHSVGDYSAAHFAGVFSLEDGLRLLAEQSRLIQKIQSKGAMAVIFTSANKLSEILKPFVNKVSIAAHNGPENTVISGESIELNRIIDQIRVEGQFSYQILKGNHAYHSYMMDGILNDFHKMAQSVQYQNPRIPMVSSLTGKWITEENSITAEYWKRQIRQPVQFAEGMKTLVNHNFSVILECGPHPSLIGMGQRCTDHQGEDGTQWLPSLSRDKDDWELMLTSLAQLYVSGYPIDWYGFHQDYSCRCLSLPTYPFDRQSFALNLNNEPKNTRGQNQDKVHKNLVRPGEHAKIGYELIKGMVYDLKWEIQEKILKNNNRNELKKGAWLLFADSRGFSTSLAEALGGVVEEVIIVCTGNSYEKKQENEFHINPSSTSDMDRLFSELFSKGKNRNLRGILFAWTLDISEMENCQPGSEDPEFSPIDACQSVINLLRSHTSHLNPNHKARIWLLTKGCQFIDNGDRGKLPIAIHQAPILGLGKVISLELPQLWGGVIDLDEDSRSKNVSMVLEEVLDANEEDQIAFRGNQRFVPRLSRHEISADLGNLDIRANAIYLITGGLGGLGLKIARWLAENGARSLLLMSRTSLPPRNSWKQSQEEETSLSAKIAAILELESLGVSVHLASVDVGNKNQLMAYLNDFRKESWPPIRGIFHAAGLLEDGPVLKMKTGAFSKVFLPKVMGGWLLHQCFQDTKLDYFILFSSAASLLGSPGQANYAAANAFLDNLAHYRRSNGLPATSVNWGAWGEIGVVARAEYVDQLAKRGILSFSPEEGLVCLDYAMRRGQTQIGAMSIDWQEHARNHSSGGHSPLLFYLVPRPQSTAKNRLNPEKDRPQKNQELSPRIKGLVAELLKTDPTHMDERNPMNSLGFDSIMAVQLRTELECQFGVDISNFDYSGSSLTDLIQFVSENFQGNNA